MIPTITNLNPDRIGEVVTVQFFRARMHAPDERLGDLITVVVGELQWYSLDDVCLVFKMKGGSVITAELHEVLVEIFPRARP